MAPDVSRCRYHRPTDSVTGQTVDCRLWRASWLFVLSLRSKYGGLVPTEDLTYENAYPSEETVR